MAHGSGGAAGHELMEKILLPAFDNEYLREMHDGAKLDLTTGKIAFTTDSYVVKPLFFSGGNIGKLAVCGTVNDLAMTGAVPKYISVGMIIEEGFALSDLRQIVNTMRRAADEAGVYIVTGDTKVVNKGMADGIFINTAGIGERDFDFLRREGREREDAVLFARKAQVDSKRFTGLPERFAHGDDAQAHVLDFAAPQGFKLRVVQNFGHDRGAMQGRIRVERAGLPLQNRFDDARLTRRGGGDVKRADAFAVKAEALGERNGDKEVHARALAGTHRFRVRFEALGEALIGEVEEGEKVALGDKLNHLCPLLARQIGSRRVVTANLQKHHHLRRKRAEVFEHFVEEEPALSLFEVPVG